MILSLAATSIQLGLLLQAGVVMTALKFSAALSTCDRAMKAACSADRSAAKYLMKLRGVKVSETVSGLLYRSRLAEITWEKLSLVSLILSSIWHVGSDVHQTGDRRIRPRFGNYRSPVAVSDKNAWSILLSQDALRSGDILLERRLRLLNDADIVAIFDKNVVNAPPARTICPGAMDEYDVF